ncbi:MAG TPA: IucA/IucC family protein, partial [Streptomyces sp.]
MTSGGDARESALLLRVLSTLLREDVRGLRTRTTAEDHRDGRWLRLAGDPGLGQDDLLLPVAEDGFQCEYAARRPLVRCEPVAGPARELTGGDEILAALARFAEPEDAAGFTAFAAEYRDALASLRLQDATRERTMTRLAARHGPDPASWRGLTGSLAFDTLAARRGHPLYPTSAARPGLTADQLLAHAPEFAPSFRLRWLAVPRSALTTSGVPAGEPLTAFWPAPSDLGLTGLDSSHMALPVHPLTAAGPLAEALRESGQAGRARLAETPYLTVRPTLSTRTVALSAHPDVHLKLPLPTATLGLLNRRTIKPGTLVDGAAAQR